MRPESLCRFSFPRPICWDVGPQLFCLPVLGMNVRLVIIFPKNMWICLRRQGATFQKAEDHRQGAVFFFFLSYWISLFASAECQISQHLDGPANVLNSLDYGRWRGDDGTGGGLRRGRSRRWIPFPDFSHLCTVNLRRGWRLVLMRGK